MECGIGFDRDMKIAQLLLYLSLLLPGIVSGICTVDQWNYLTQLRRYLQIIRQPKTFLDAQIHCEKLGGQLLTIHDGQTQTALSHWFWNGTKTDAIDSMTPFWIGLSNKATGQFQWVDGLRLGVDYNKTVQCDVDDKTYGCCVSVTWDLNETWDSQNCSSRSFFICEAKVPCSSRPVMRINHRPTRLENDTAFIVHERDIFIYCFLRGFPDSVTRVELECDDHKDSHHAGDNTAHTLIHVDFRMHGKSCFCRSIYPSGGRQEKSQITIHFQSEPVLINGTGNNKILFASEVDPKFYLNIEVFSNPEINVTALSKDGISISVDDYFLIIERTLEGFSKVNLVIDKEGSDDRTGSYVLWLRNGIGDPLLYPFDVKDFHQILPETAKEEVQKSRIVTKDHTDKKELSSTHFYFVMAAGIVANLIMTGCLIALTLKGSGHAGSEGRSRTTLRGSEFDWEQNGDNIGADECSGFWHQYDTDLDDQNPLMKIKNRHNNLKQMEK